MNVFILEVIKTTIGGPSPDLNPKEHRLQRQDAKSRKTFKMKRQKTKTTSVRRFMSRRGQNDTSDTESNSTEGSPTRRSRRKRFPPEQEALTLHRTGTGTRSPRSGSPRTDSQLARSVETIPESLEDPKVLFPMVFELHIWSSQCNSGYGCVFFCIGGFYFKLQLA